MRFFALFIRLLFLPFGSFAQPAQRAAFVLHIRPVLNQKKLMLNTGVAVSDDSIALQQLRFYLGQFTFSNKGKTVFQDTAYHLVDLEEDHTQAIVFDFPQKMRFDRIAFNFGVDSLTTASGAMGGDLDPTKGMFWTWQSGYIHFKMEGFSKKSSGRNGLFQFHLGGYLPPFQTLQRVYVDVERRKGDTHFELVFDLAALFREANWTKFHNIMSPGAEAVRLSGILAKSFSVHAE